MGVKPCCVWVSGWVCALVVPVGFLYTVVCRVPTLMWTVVLGKFDGVEELDQKVVAVDSVVHPQLFEWADALILDLLLQTLSPELFCYIQSLACLGPLASWFSSLLPLCSITCMFAGCIGLRAGL